MKSVLVAVFFVSCFLSLSFAVQIGRESDVDCPSGNSKCPSGTTCCDLGGGTFGCCPIPGAVCCSDHLHCCPHGMQCDTVEGRCIDRFTRESSPMYRKFAATMITK